MTYDNIYIIYNPNSTGDSEAEARELARTLQKSINDTSIECIPTEYAGHAEKLARDLAEKHTRPLIISSSGDGGYNEVVNGVMAANNPQTICAVLPAGNANDHARTMQSQPLAEAIIKAKVTKIDLLEVRVAKSNSKVIRYAHSYAGLGITPVIAVELNKHSLNSLKEAFVVLKTFLKYRPFKIKHGQKLHKLDSLLFGNINQMAKVLTIAPKNRPTDGKFEIVSFPSGPKQTLVRRLAKAAINEPENIQRAAKYEFTVIKKMPMQLDGEVMVLKSKSQVTVRARQKVLPTIV